MEKQGHAERFLTESRFLKKLANSKRLQICLLLSQDEFDVNSLATEVGLSQSALSQHLARLHQSGLVSFRKKAQFRYYRCGHPGVLAILTTLSALQRSGHFTRASSNSLPSQPAQ
ncbi:ArsR/SmtB family transcription factor [Rhizobium leguminosarum]|uniref:ArsR/SmtB family transcription factor n=1 Tax=Rhizobium leguminosarum TaxID=384 RepID=UPI0009D6DA46|nr:metalloregulator ArsR/SmtB family transcription factor [Rhizobium leguminosarum]